MLIEFQQALADLTASPRLCREIQQEPNLLKQRYSLSDVEARRLTAMVNSPGMTSNNVLYRANRLAPIVLNLPALSRLLGNSLKSLLGEFWEQSPETDVNFLVESARFCEFLERKQEQGYQMNAEAAEAFAREHEELRLRLLAIETALAGS